MTVDQLRALAVEARRYIPEAWADDYMLQKLAKALSEAADRLEQAETHIIELDDEITSLEKALVDAVVGRGAP